MRNLIVSFTCLVLLSCLVRSASAVECITPLQWQPKLTSTPLDTNANYVDDAIDAMNPTDVIDVVVLLNRSEGEIADGRRS